MNRLLLMMGLLLILIMPQAWGYTSKYPNPYRQTMWNSMTDGMHTFGQSSRQAGLTKMKLHNARTKARINSINQARLRTWRQSHN
jgi:hypothetical protein